MLAPDPGRFSGMRNCPAPGGHPGGSPLLLAPGDGKQRTQLKSPAGPRTWNRYQAVHSSKGPSLEGHAGTSLSGPPLEMLPFSHLLRFLGATVSFQITLFLSQATPPPPPPPLPPPPPAPHQTQGARELNCTALGRLQAGLLAQLC